MRGWTWTNDNNKHKYKNSDSGNFSMMIKLKECIDVSFMVSHTVYFKGMMFFTLTSQMYHRISVLMPVLVEYLSTCPRVRVQVRVLWLWNSGVRVHYKYQKFSTRVLRVRVLSMSTPALISSQIIHDHMEIIQYQHLLIYLFIYLFICLFINLFIWYITSVQFLCVQQKLVTW